MEFSSYVRKPFSVKVVVIDDDNIVEVAKMTGTLETNDDGTKYIEVDRKKVPNLGKIHKGFLLTKMDKQYRCYPPHIFEKLFVESTPELESLIKELNGRE